MSDHVDSFYAAVSVLTGHGRIKQRLIKAYEENLAVIEDEDLPIAVKQSFADLRHMMSRVDPVSGNVQPRQSFLQREGRIRASVRKMSATEADKCAHKMIDLYRDMIRYSDKAQKPLRQGRKRQLKAIKT